MIPQIYYCAYLSFPHHILCIFTHARTGLTYCHCMCAQYFGDISVLLERPEPATIRVSSLKVGHWL